MSIRDRLARGVNLLLAAAIGMIAVTCTARAVTLVKVANSALIPYVIGSGGDSGPISPPSNQAVFVMGVCTTFNFRGTGHVAMLHVPGSFLEWTGLNSTSNGTATSGFSGSSGTNIVQLDFAGNVHIQVNDPDSFKIHNSAGFTNTGNVTLMW